MSSSYDTPPPVHVPQGAPPGTSGLSSPKYDPDPDDEGPDDSTSAAHREDSGEYAIQGDDDEGPYTPDPP